ncbi:MAG: S41 family peptidase [Pseudomonadota bacterium]
MNWALLSVRRLILAALISCFSFHAVAEEPTSHQPEKAFEAFWSLYDTQYALFEVKRVDWDALYRAYRPRVTERTSRAELFDIFVEMTALLNDVHVTVEDLQRDRLERSGARSIGRGPFDAGEFSLDLIARDYLTKPLETRAGGVIKFGELPGGAGYLRIEAFKYATSTEQAINEFVENFKAAPAVIIDVRQNGGGADRIGQLIAERFATERVKYMSSQGRIPGKDRTQFRDPIEWVLNPSADHQYDGPVYVLANSRTISAAENFILAMRAISRSVIIGDVTAGAMADTIPITLDDGWRFSVPVNIFRDADGVCWEGVGLAPDLWVRNTPEDIAGGQDKVLALALALIE